MFGKINEKETFGGLGRKGVITLPCSNKPPGYVPLRLVKV